MTKTIVRYEARYLYSAVAVENERDPLLRLHANFSIVRNSVNRTASNTRSIRDSRPARILWKILYEYLGILKLYCTGCYDNTRGDFQVRFPVSRSLAFR